MSYVAAKSRRTFDEAKERGVGVDIVRYSSASLELPGMLACDSSVRELVIRGTVTTSGVPILRWNEGVSVESGVGVSATYGAFSRHALRFDVSAFSISPAESRQMDALMAMALEGGHAAYK